MNKKMYTKKQIVEKLNEKYGNNNVCIVSTEGYDLTTYPTWEIIKKSDVCGQMLLFVNYITVKTESE